ncbi:hypothetical protein C8J57DRAFT_961182, partial [Mycena rebaudengoi]
RSIDLFIESLSSSIERFHEQYDPFDESKDDPLLDYSAIDGTLQGITAESAILLRDVIIRYTAPHRSFLWDDLPSSIVEILKIDAESLAINSVRDPSNGERCFCLDLTKLSAMAHTVLAVQQILDVLNEFLSRKPSARFILDPDFQFLYLMERCKSRWEIQFAFSAMQLRLSRADTHIRSYLASVRETLMGRSVDERISSVNSTLSEVRAEFGRESASRELLKLLARTDYGERV